MGLMAVVHAIIGLVLIYFLTSVFCSGINECIAQRSGRRGRFLREGLLNLVGDRWLYLHVINHPLVARMYRDLPGKPRTPSYIPASSFVAALIDIVLLKARQLDGAVAAGAGPVRTFADVRAAILRGKDFGYSVADAMLPLLDAAEGDLDRARRNLETWYEHAMERVSGWYKARTVRLLFVIGLSVAALFNIDTVQIATQLSRAADGRESLAAGDGRGLPVGFACLSPATLSTAGGARAGLRGVLRQCWSGARQEAGGAWLVKIIGWLLTGLAVMLGAPFWFYLLNKLINVRGAGRRPDPPPPAPAPRCARGGDGS